MMALQRAAVCLLVVLAIPAPGAASEAPSGPSRRTPLTHFGAAASIVLRGDGATASVGFGSRADELVTRAALHLRFTHSPAPPPGAELRVALNGDAVAQLPLGGGNDAAVVVAVDPRLVVGFNQLTLTLHVPGDAAVTATVDGESELELALRPLELADDLAILPEPFFDRRDQRRVTVPFVFAARPAHSTLRAAAVVASWLGHLAQWRGARFPAELDAARGGHAIAFLTNAERPEFLSAVAPAAGPELRLMTHPVDQRSKLLLVLGRDGDDLLAAARALVRVRLAGARVAVAPGPAAAPRAAYDAPGWVRLDRPVKLGELVASPRQLEVAGSATQLDPIRVELRVPPGLDGAGVPLALALRYAPPACVSDAHLDVAVNGEVVEISMLPVGAAAMSHARTVSIPPGRLRGRDELAFQFRFALQDASQCRDPRAHATTAAVAAESTLDLSGQAQRARLPNLALFAHAGYPFTRFADLSQTVVVLPDTPASGDIEAMLALLGRLGEAAGSPATGVRVASAADEAALADADLLVIGAPGDTPRADRWIDTSMARGVSHRGSGPLAGLYGSESPVSAGRSVVALTAIAPDQMLRMVDVLDDPKLRAAVGGGAAFVLPGKVESVAPRRAYTAGERCGEHRIALAALAAALVLGVAAAAAYGWWIRSRRARSGA